MLLLLPGEISAKALWDALRQRSTKMLDEMETETSQVCFKQHYSSYYKNHGKDYEWHNINFTEYALLS